MAGARGNERSRESMGKHPEKRRPIQAVSSYGDEQRRPINSLMLSLGNNLARVMCEYVWMGRGAVGGGRVVFTSVCACVCVKSVCLRRFIPQRVHRRL